MKFIVVFVSAADPVPERSIPSMDRRLVGMCVLTGNLYAVFKDLKAVYEYNIDDVNSFDKIDVRDLKVPADITSCSVNQCLYVTDCDSSKFCVWKIKIADRNPKLWLSGITRPYTLSVNSRGEVLMLCNSTASTSVLKIFKDSNGKAGLLRELDFFEIGIRIPSFAKQLDGRHIIVCEGEPGQHVQRIYLVEDVFGKLVRGSLEKPPDRLHSMYCPVYADSCRNEVLVADRNNERVVLFDLELKFVKVVASYRSDRFGKPIRLHYDPSSQRLFVGQECGIRIYSYPVVSGATSK